MVYYRLMALTTLCTIDQLAAHLTEWRVFDCRHDLMKPELGAQQYREAHIPGALFAHLEHDLSAPKSGRNGRHPLPRPDAFVAWLGTRGIRPDEQIVCYDAGSGAIAARLWWMLRWVGHRAVAVLDGGLAKWLKEGHPVDAAVPQPKPTIYPSRSASGTVDVSAVHAGLDDLYLLDARAPARYRGEQEPIDPVAGHIPGARNRFNMDNVLPDGTFKDKESLKRDFLSILKNQKPDDVVHYCGSGVSACHNLLAMEVAGLPGGKLYAGSWSEWIADPSRPQEKS
jgi:thiosulfate/3-mercaptopyruvate sulfurtransferase